MSEWSAEGERRESERSRKKGKEKEKRRVRDISILLFNKLFSNLMLREK